MATPRSPYVCIADSLLRESWPAEVKLAAVLLSCHIHERWRSDRRLSLEDACMNIELGLADLIACTTRTSRARCVGVMRALCERTGVVIVRESPTFTVSWPKWAEYNGKHSRVVPRDGARDREDDRPVTGPSASASLNRVRKKKNTEKSADSVGLPLVPTDLLSASKPDQRIEGIWTQVQGAFDAYGKPAPALTKSRRVACAARLRDHPGEPPKILVEAVHGRMAGHQRGSGYDPAQHLTPESVFRPQKFWRDVEAYRAALERGEKPPFVYKGPEAKGADRTLAERVRDISEGRFAR